MSREGVHKLIGMACIDPEFRHKLIEDPEAAAKEYNVELTPQELENLRKVNPADIDEFADHFVSRFGTPRASF